MQQLAAILLMVSIWTILLERNIVAQASARARHQSARIFNGSEALQGQFPWQVAIYATTPNGTFLCGGALIYNNWIVTAAHCLVNFTSVSISLGSTTLHGPNKVTIIISEEITIHEGFVDATLSNDIALIKIPGGVPFANIKPIDLPSTLITEGSNVAVSGWGLTGHGDSPSEILKFVNLTIVSDTTCKKTFSLKGNGVICAQGRNGGGTCEGDSGGPLVVDALGPNPVLVGIVSFSNQNGCSSSDPRGFTNIFNYIEWIKKVTGR